MEKIKNWIKNNKLATVLIAITAYLVLPIPSLGVIGGSSGSSKLSTASYGIEPAGIGGFASDAQFESAESRVAFEDNSLIGIPAPIPPIDDTVPEVPNDQRKIRKDADLSILVKDVNSVVEQVESVAQQFDGYVISSNVRTPSEGGSGNVTLRVPSENLEDALQSLKGLAIKVVQENVSGNDVTTQYTDLQERLDTLQGNKTRIEAIMEQAEEVEEILRIQNQLFNIQNQIDGVIGQLNYIERTTRTSRITISLSTDELALPYSPSDPWRPEVTFKLAVRSLQINLRAMGDWVIWIAVYSPVILAGYVVYKLLKKKKNSI